MLPRRQKLPSIRDLPWSLTLRRDGAISHQLGKNGRLGKGAKALSAPAHGTRTRQGKPQARKAQNLKRRIKEDELAFMGP